jgi:hypothetical protein
MKKLNRTAIKKHLAKLYWDYAFDKTDLYRLLIGEVETVSHVHQDDLYYRILTTYDWYTILKIIPPGQLKDALNDRILNKIRFKDLKARYQYARESLS